MSSIDKNIRGLDLDLSHFSKSEVVNINESKTPLAHVHAGSLRRIFLHFQLQQRLIAENFKTDFFLGNDDYDPYDYFPNYFSDKQRAEYRPFLGHPLCSVPAPKGEGSYADYYFDEMVEILRSNFDITVTKYKTSELYQRGVFDKGIKLVLQNIEKLNEIYKSITGISDKFSARPLQVICRKCGNMRTTRIVDYGVDEVKVTCDDYTLRDILFKGCGFEGTVSPYQGNARLVWKLEWPVRWFYLNIGVEGGRKDQNSEKGARKFAEVVYEFLFHKKPPMNLPYDFCYVRSKQSPQINRFGISATEALKFLPPQLFFDLLTEPRNTQPIDLDLESEKMLDIYQDYTKKYWADSSGQVFSKILEYVRFDSTDKLSATYEPLAKCIRHYLHTSDATDAWFVNLKQKQVDRVEQSFLARLAKKLENAESWQASKLQYIFGKTAADMHFSLSDACLLIYRLLLERQSGLRIGVLFEKIGRERVLNYLRSFE